MKLKMFRCRPFAQIPKFETEGAAAMDIKSAGYAEIKPGARALIPTGLMMEIEDGYKGRLLSRSGIANKNGVHVIAGLIDDDYRGEVFVVLLNSGEETFIVEKGHRIAQLSIERKERVEVEEVEHESLLNPTKRGQGGFGHTGMK